MLHDHDVAVSKVAAPFSGTWVGTALAPYKNYLTGFAWAAIPAPARVAMLARCETSEATSALASVVAEVSSSIAAPSTSTPEDGVNFRVRAAAYLLSAVASEPALLDTLTSAMASHANWLRVGSSITKLSVNNLAIEDVYEGLSDEVRSKITSSPGGISGAWLSFSDLERTQVILSRPVMEANPAKLQESLVVAVQQALNAYVLAVPAVSAVIETSPQVIISTGPAFSSNIASDLMADGSSPAVADAVAWLSAITKVLEAKTPELRTTLVDDIRACCYSMSSQESETSIRRFWAALRECYTTDEIASAFVPHNIALNVVSGDIATTQNFLSSKMLGGLASSFMACEDLAGAWVAMPLHSYLELCMSGLIDGDAALVDSASRVRRVFVKIIAKSKESLLREILIAGTEDESAFVAIENLLVKPSLNSYRLADFTYPEPPPREFAHKLVHLANRVRLEEKITPEWVKDFQNIMTSALITPEEVTALGRAGAMMFSQETVLPILEAAISDYGKTSGS